MSEHNADGTVETPTVESLQAQLQKAEAKIVDLKKSTKETVTAEVPKTKPVIEDNNYMTREDYKKEEFFKNNPELLEHKDIINEKVSNGYSLEDAKMVTLAQDATIQARKNTQNSNFTSGTPDYQSATISKDQLEKAEGAEYNRLRDLIESGKSTLEK